MYFEGRGKIGSREEKREKKKKGRRRWKEGKSNRQVFPFRRSLLLLRRRKNEGSLRGEGERRKGKKCKNLLFSLSFSLYGKRRKEEKGKPSRLAKH